MHNLSPIDYKNLNDKAVFNYIQFKDKLKSIGYKVPKFLYDEKISLLDELYKIGNSIEEIEEHLKVLPTFDRQFLINDLNSKKVANRKNEVSSKIKASNHNI